MKHDYTRANTWTCRVCGATAVQAGFPLHGWVQVSRIGPHGSTAWLCGWACALRWTFRQTAGATPLEALEATAV